MIDLAARDLNDELRDGQNCLWLGRNHCIPEFAPMLLSLPDGFGGSPGGGSLKSGGKQGSNGLEGFIFLQDACVGGSRAYRESVLKKNCISYLNNRKRQSI